MDDPDLIRAVMQAVSSLVTKDVPGSLLVMSMALNFVLLAPHVVRALRGGRNVDQ